MFDRLFERLFLFVHRRKKAVIGTVLAVTAAAAAFLPFVRYEGNIDLMLPPDPEVTRSLRFLRDSSLSDKIVVSLELTDPAKDKKDLFAAVDQFGASLTPPLFTKVTSGFSLSDVMEEFSVLQYAPQVLGENDRAEIDKKLTEPAVAASMRSIYLQSLRPESIFTSSLNRADPLAIKSLLYGKLRALPASMGYDVSVEEGHFISRDGRHAMLIVQTAVPMMDGQRSKELVAALESHVRALPPYIRADMIGGHLHTVSNERVMKRDITVASLVVSAAFLILFFVMFRDVRAIFVFIIPLIAVAWAIVIATGLEGNLSYLVIGFGTAIAGISIDYGLLVYIAMKRGADSSQMVKLAKLVSIDAITTMFSFAVLYLSLVRGYHQLALFSVLCVALCLIISLFVLPLVLSWKKFEVSTDPAIGDRLKAFRWPVKTSVAVWAALTVFFLILSFSLTFESDVKKLDGSEPAVHGAERKFHELWGGKTNQAILVVEGATVDEAMEKNDAVYREAVAAVGGDNITSLALFWNSAKTRRENTAQWDRFWRDGRERKLRKLIRNASAAYGFSDRAFSPFFDGLYNHAAPQASTEGLISRLQDRFVVTRQSETSILSFFPDEKQQVDAIKAIATKHPGVFIVSGRALSSSISSFTSRELKLLAPAAILFNIVLAWMFFRNWTETFISLVPVLTGVVWLGGIMSLLNIPLNVVSVVAAIVTTGVIVDYGLGMTYEYRYHLRTGTVMAVTLSAATNIIGTGVLLFADHPALFSTSVAMVICMVTGYLSALIVVPSFCSIMGTRTEEAPSP